MVKKRKGQKDELFNINVSNFIFLSNKKLFIYFLQLAAAQLLQTQDEILQINALQDFGAKTHKRNNRLQSHKLKTSELDEVEQFDVSNDKTSKKNYSEKIKITDIVPKKWENRKRIPVNQKKEILRASLTVAQDEEDGKEIMVPQESNRGATKYFNDVHQQDLGRGTRKQFSKKVSVPVGTNALGSRSVSRKKEPMTDIEGFTNIARRGQRQVHMEEMAHAHIKDIVAECGDSQISVQLEFNEAFHGVVYSKGHYNDPKCT